MKMKNKRKLQLSLLEAGVRNIEGETRKVIKIPDINLKPLPANSYPSQDIPPL